MIDWQALYHSLTADTVDTGDTVSAVSRRNAVSPTAGRDSVTSVNSVNPKEKQEGGQVLSLLAAALSALERRCPDHIYAADWQHAVEDGRRLMLRWRELGEVPGWTADDVFGLPPVPEQPSPNYRRLARYDLAGLIWLLRGRKVVALSTDRAVIATPSETSIHGARYPGSIQRGTITFYRRANQP
jgi:hypothetical protein